MQDYAASGSGGIRSGGAFDITSIKTALEDTNLFQQVRWADRNLDYSLSIATARYDLEDAGDLTSAALAGASLMILPIQTSYH